jgi:hypothetical protein
MTRGERRDNENENANNYNCITSLCVSGPPYSLTRDRSIPLFCRPISKQTLYNKSTEGKRLLRDVTRGTYTRLIPDEKGALLGNSRRRDRARPTRELRAPAEGYSSAI